MRLLGVISDLFLTKRFCTQKSIKSTKCKQAIFIQMFLYAQKVLKSKQVTFKQFLIDAFKGHKKQTSE